MVVYFSGTGNSRYCAQFLSAKLGDPLTDAFPYIRGDAPASLASALPWVFVSPTYAWQLPHVFADFIRKSRFRGSREAYFVMTCGSEIGSAEETIQSLCEAAGFLYRGVLQVIMPENYLAMFPVPNAAQCVKIIAEARPTLYIGVECITQGCAFPDRKTGPVDQLKSGLVNRLFYKYAIKTKPFYATDACISCGKCAGVCPLNSITLKDGKPVWDRACTHCMACITVCPKEAIEYGRNSLGQYRYRCIEYHG